MRVLPYSSETFHLGSSLHKYVFFLRSIVQPVINHLWDAEIEQIELWASECSSASVQLVRSGLFPCSPIFPTLAVDIRELDFVRRLFLRIAPNYTAWCSAATDFLAAQGYQLPGEDPLRRRFANALQWFMSLHDMSSAQIDTILHGVRADLIPSSSVTGTYRSPAAHCDHATTEAASQEASSDSDTDTIRPKRRQVTVEEVADEDLEESNSRKRNRENSSEEEEWDPSTSDLRFSPLARPSEYLRTRCPLCFGGRW
jgi:hypothetical protein